MSLIVVDFVSATVKRDKVRRMVEKGDTVKKTAIKNQEEELKQEEIEVEKEQVVEENDCDKGLEEETKESDAEQSEDADEKPEPMVVFL